MSKEEVITENEAENMPAPKAKIMKTNPFISKPLFMQSLKANWVFWLVMTIGVVAIFMIINIVIGSKPLFNNIDMNKVMIYVEDENMNWLQILGLLETMGFKLNRIQVMSQVDLNSIVNELVYKIAGVILPMIYVMSVSNKLIAAQVSEGSMAYILSTPTSRKTVLRTQFTFLVSSLVVMYILIIGATISSEYIAAGMMKAAGYTEGFQADALKSFLYCLGSFLAMFALGGICFGASAYFNKSSYSIAVGGGVCVLAFLGCILGLFGNKIFVAVGIGVEAMNVFNYVSVLTLLDTEGISNFCKSVRGVQDAVASYDWIWEMAVMFGIGAVMAFLGSLKFVKKDLPL